MNSGPITLYSRRLSEEQYFDFLRARLLRKSRRDPASGCLIWTGNIDSCGYGRMGFYGRLSGVHRIAYTVWIGPIPDGMEIDHVRTRGCVSRACFEPAHLEPVTRAENNRRAGGITHCKRAGHPLFGANLYLNPASGKRICRQCKHEGRARWAA
jgi:hypothetical protein